MSENKTAPDAIVKGILDDAFSKYRKGEEKHGVIDLDNDPRNFLEEAEDELLDAIVYMAFEIRRIRALNILLNNLGQETFTISVQSLDASALKTAMEQELVPAIESENHEEPTL